MNGDKKLIDSLYKRFGRRSANLDDRRLDLLCDNIIDRHGLEMNDESKIFSEMEPDAPLRSIRLDNIHGVAEFGEVLAIVMHSSIIFFNRRTLRTSVHLKPARRFGFLRFS